MQRATDGQCAADDVQQAMDGMQRTTFYGWHATGDVQRATCNAGLIRRASSCYVWAGLTPKRAVDEYFCDAMQWAKLNTTTESIINITYAGQARADKLRRHTAHLDMLAALESAHHEMEKVYKARGGTASHQG